MYPPWALFRKTTVNTNASSMPVSVQPDNRVMRQFGIESRKCLILSVKGIRGGSDGVVLHYNISTLCVTYEATAVCVVGT